MARRKKLHPALDMRVHIAEDIRICEWPGCTEGAEHRAPRSREQLREYRWFCMPHAREYNSRWNYFEGMSDAEVEADLRRDTVWQRPTWPIGDGEGKSKKGPKPGPGPFGIDPEYFTDDFGLFGDDVAGRARAGQERVDGDTRTALAIFGLSLPTDEETVKSTYKALVKKHHPDANGGDKDAEEKFKQIREAYETLRKFLVI